MDVTDRATIQSYIHINSYFNIVKIREKIVEDPQTAFGSNGLSQGLIPKHTKYDIIIAALI